MTTHKTLYTAKFSDGEVITRRSERTYTHAWRVKGTVHQTAKGKEIKPFEINSHGFSRTEALARKAAKDIDGYWIGTTIEVVPLASPGDGPDPMDWR